MQPFTVWDVVALLVTGGMAVQAILYQRVEQTSTKTLE
jgi:uncharacterized membrane protein YpjA